VWQWWNFCKGKVANGKTVLRVNLGETAVCIFQGGQKGNVFVTKKRPRDEPVQHISKGRRRCYLTHIALVCDRTDLQPSPPQVIVGNERTFLAGGMGALATARPANVRLVRQKSAWNNKDLVCRVIRWLAEALRPHMHEVQPVLFFDACMRSSPATRYFAAACIILIRAPPVHAQSARWELRTQLVATQPLTPFLGPSGAPRLWPRCVSVCT
jgi:hypothetical protein